jgi:hypothetical protein
VHQFVCFVGNSSLSFRVKIRKRLKICFYIDTKDDITRISCSLLQHEEVASRERAAAATISSEYNSRRPYLAENTYPCAWISLFFSLSLSWVCRWCYCFRTGLTSVLAAFEAATFKGTVTWKSTHLFSITFCDITQTTDNWVIMKCSICWYCVLCSRHSVRKMNA